MSGGGHQVVPEPEAARAHCLADGVGRLIEGQRRFAEEFGLAHERVFSADFEPFKGRDPSRVVREWMYATENESDELEVLLNDLADHQLALMQSVEAIAQDSVGPFRRFMDRVLSTRWGRRWCRPRTGSLVTRVVAAYAHSRETATLARCSGNHKET